MKNIIIIMVFISFLYSNVTLSFTVEHRSIIVKHKNIFESFFKIEVGKPEILTGNTRTIIDFANNDRSGRIRSTEDCLHKIDSDTTKLLGGLTELSFQWHFNAENLDKLLLQDSILVINYQIVDVDSNFVIDNCLSTIIGEGNETHYDSASGQYINLFNYMGTRRYSFNAINGQRIMTRTLINKNALVDTSYLEYLNCFIYIDYDDSTQYYNTNFYRNQLPLKISNIVSSVKGNYINPTGIQLARNYPNPFNSSTIIEYKLPKRACVTLTIYNLLGTEVAVLVNEEKYAGNYKIECNMNNFASGIYFYNIQAGDFTKTRKFILMK